MCFFGRFVFSTYESPLCTKVAVSCPLLQHSLVVPFYNFIIKSDDTNGGYRSGELCQNRKTTYAAGTGCPVRVDIKQEQWQSPNYRKGLR
ncbi:hypothetical protein GDO81_026660 [Engystomops pustulosus]|uniref:Secreted protein n=1 Tax=Engystomops pustulosus TaxID=76066 RepID=A0AAV6YM12_ENGPU|nr:hypothetical protein GDO81_026660 [Engystomops pustulosus]